MQEDDKTRNKSQLTLEKSVRLTSEMIATPLQASRQCAHQKTLFKRQPHHKFAYSNKKYVEPEVW